MKNPIKIINTKIINKVLIFILTGTRPILGPARCRYKLSCTKFAVLQLETKPLLSALWATIKRILSCNPFAR